MDDGGEGEVLFGVRSLRRYIGMRSGLQAGL